MKRLTLALAIIAAAFAPAMAQQAPTETVIVTAPKLNFAITPNAVSHAFIRSYAMPSVLTEQISRWEVGICPAFYGVAPQFADVMETRLRAMAKQVGAPLKDKGCKPNLFIFFAGQPQAQLNALHAKNVDVLGFHGAATVTHPIQAWYETGIRDLYGNVFMDQENFFEIDPFEVPPQVAKTSLTPVTNVGGWRYRTDLASDLLYVTIIVDSSKTAHLMVGSVADYVAMLALSRTEAYDACQIVPSIANLLSPDCDDKLKPDIATASDIAYLRGVYKMDPGAKLIVQQDEIAAEMAKVITVKAGP